MCPGLRLLEKLKCEPPIPLIARIQHNCAGLYEWTIAVVESGLERRADMVCLLEPPRDCNRFKITHTA